jgi:hypothetical protein
MARLALIMLVLPSAIIVREIIAAQSSRRAAFA